MECINGSEECTLPQQLTEFVGVRALPGSVEQVQQESITSHHNTYIRNTKGGIMKDTLGIMLRTTWKEKGKSDCHHPDLHKEYSFSGTVTGCYICATCGQLMRMDQVQTQRGEFIKIDERMNRMKESI